MKNIDKLISTFDKYGMKLEFLEGKDENSLVRVTDLETGYSYTNNFKSVMKHISRGLYVGLKPEEAYRLKPHESIGEKMIEGILISEINMEPNEICRNKSMKMILTEIMGFAGDEYEKIKTQLNEAVKRAGIDTKVTLLSPDIFGKVNGHYFAIEYHGMGHSEQIAAFHKDEADLIHDKELDIAKRIIMAELGVNLLVISGPDVFYFNNATSKEVKNRIDRVSVEKIMTDFFESV